MVTVNSIKQELSVESVLPMDTQMYDPDLDEAAPAPTPHLIVDSASLAEAHLYDIDNNYRANSVPAREQFIVPRQEPQVPWWQPKSTLVPGLQDAYESEFKVPHNIWPSVPAAQVKAPNRIVPTILDQYAIQLASYEAHDRPGKRGFRQNAPAASGGTPSREWEDFIQRDYQQQMNLLEQQNKRRLETHQAGARQMGWSREESSTTEEERRKAMSPTSGRNWSPPFGWEESLSPDYRLALKYLRETTLARNKDVTTSSLSNNVQTTPSLQEQDTTAGHRPVFTPKSTQGNREQSVDSVWSTQFTPESTPGSQEGGENRLKFEVESSPNILDLNNQDSQHSCQCGSGRNCDFHLAMLDQVCCIALRRKEMTRYLVTAESQFDSHGSRTIQGYQMQLIPLEQQNERGMTAPDTTKSSVRNEDDENAASLTNGSRHRVLPRSLVIRDRSNLQ